LQCLPAELHNRPAGIPAAVLAGIERNRARYEHIFVAYADCGTGGMLDRMLEGTGVERIPGAHCYEFFAGSERFHQCAAAEPGSFFLTDFLVRHFDRLVVQALGLDRWPGLLPVYFAHYRRAVYIAQSDDGRLQDMARRQADYLGLEYRYLPCGDGPLTLTLRTAVAEEAACRN